MIGATLIKYLKEAYGEFVELISLGTNAIATVQMLKAGANRGASGENAICRTVAEADCMVLASRLFFQQFSFLVLAENFSKRGRYLLYNIHHLGGRCGPPAA
jgi:hypothetical protein